VFALTQTASAKSHGLSGDPYSYQEGRNLEAHDPTIGFHDQGNYNEFYGAYTWYNPVYQRESSVANLGDENYQHLYQ